MKPIWLHDTYFLVGGQINVAAPLDSSPKQPAIHILRMHAQWWVLHWAQGILMAPQAYTPNIDPKNRHGGQHHLLQATAATGGTNALWEVVRTAM